MMWGYDGFGYGGFGMGIGMLLFWGLIILGIVMLVRGFGGTSHASGSRPGPATALDIVAERYARGEIDRSEFEQKRSDLRNAQSDVREQAAGARS